MAYIEVCEGTGLNGEIRIQGSKNAALPMLAACVLCKEEIRLLNCPRIQDVYSMEALLKSIGCRTEWDGPDIIVNAGNLNRTVLNEPCAGSMRSSIFFLGPMLGRCGEVTASLPGGCSIGERPINLHEDVLKRMNVRICEDETSISCKTDALSGAVVDFPSKSVGATENAVLAAVLARGETWILNAAREPEVTALCRFLKAMGADIIGEGTGRIHISGVKELHGTRYPVMSDRIVAGTYMAAAAGVGADIFLDMNCQRQLFCVARVLREMGVELAFEERGVRVRASGKTKAAALIQTGPYPGFPTDMQAQLMAVLTKAEGESTIIENVFESRFRTAAELGKMGAQIAICGRTAKISGVKRLHGAQVSAPDLRGGAALVIAGLFAEGTTRVLEAGYILRGYESICGDLEALGARVRLVG